MKTSTVLIIFILMGFTHSNMIYSQATPSRAPITSYPLVGFEYDAAGNQIVRSLCLNCPNGNVSQRNSKEKTEENVFFEKFFPNDVLSYYPNPVKEELHLKWELIDGNSLSTIEIYSLNGQLLKTYKDLKNTNTKSVSFQEYATGIYNVLLLYSNGDQKSIKIVKQ